MVRCQTLNVGGLTNEGGTITTSCGKKIPSVRLNVVTLERDFGEASKPPRRFERRLGEGWAGEKIARGATDPQTAHHVLHSYGGLLHLAWLKAIRKVVGRLLNPSGSKPHAKS